MMTDIQNSTTLPPLGGQPFAPAAAFVGEHPDPIFGAIKAHWAAHLRLCAACLNEPPRRTPEYQAWWAAQTAATEAEDRAAWALVDTGPTTAEGAIALLNYVVVFSAGGYRSWPDNRGGTSFEEAAIGAALPFLKA